MRVTTKPDTINCDDCKDEQYFAVCISDRWGLISADGLHGVYKVKAIVGFTSGNSWSGYSHHDLVECIKNILENDGDEVHAFNTASELFLFLAEKVK